MLLFIGILYTAFSSVGNALRANETAPIDEQFLIWTLGSILFAHAATFFSVSYYDQSAIFLYLLLASIGSLPPMNSADEAASDEIAPPISPQYELHSGHDR